MVVTRIRRMTVQNIRPLLLKGLLKAGTFTLQVQQGA